MSFEISLSKIILSLKTASGELKTHALILFPKNPENFKNGVAVFTHGYTAEKTPLLPWAVRLSDYGVPTVIFDLPGHYLAHFEELASFELFKNHVHELFVTAFHGLLKETNFVANEQTKLILGGHSMGGLLAIKALMNPEFDSIEKVAIGVGVGIQADDKPHFFQSKFYEKTMQLRAQLVSPYLAPDKVFTWLFEEKKHIPTFHQKIILITGEDDIVVSRDGAERFKQLLEDHANLVTLDKPTKLAHTAPELAASTIYHHVKEFLSSNSAHSSNN